MDKDKRQTIIAVILLVILIGAVIVITYIVKFSGLANEVDNDNNNNEVINNSNPADQYVMVTPYQYADAEGIFTTFNVSTISFKNLDESLTSEFLQRQQEFIDTIDSYHQQVLDLGVTDYGTNSIMSVINYTVSDSILSVVYQFKVNIPLLSINTTEAISLNIDLANQRIMTNDLMLSYLEKDINNVANRVFEETIMTLNFEDNNYVDIDTETKVDATNVESFREVYVTKIADYLQNNGIGYIVNDQYNIMYRNSDILALLFNVDIVADAEYAIQSVQ